MRMRMRTTLGLSLALLIVSATAWAKQAHSPHHQHAASLKAKHATGGIGHAKRHSARKAAAHAERRRGPARHRVAELPPQDQYLGSLRVVGPRQIGAAAWYGGRHVGERTASGEPLDAFHATAAHRSLPLHSLVRVTNLRNGRSTIATINDRGPVSRSLLIDVSPKVAEELDMKRSGIATVAVEPVVRVAPAPH